MTVVEKTIEKTEPKPDPKAKSRYLAHQAATIKEAVGSLVLDPNDILFLQEKNVPFTRDIHGEFSWNVDMDALRACNC